MPLPRKSEFDVNLVSADWTYSGARVWAYGDPAITYPAPQWVGWDDYVPPGSNPGEVIEYEYYYDAARTFYGIADYTGDAQWTTTVRKALPTYLNYVEVVDPARFALVPPQGGVAAHNIQPWGCYLDWQRNPDATAKARARQVLFALALNASWGTSYPLEWTPDLYHAREISYNLIAKYLGLLAGYVDVYGAAPWGLGEAELVGLAYTYCDQAIGLLLGGTGNVADVNHRYVRPFMMANLAEALIQHFKATGDTRVVPKLVTLFGLLWDVCYRGNGITMADMLPDGVTPSPRPGFIYGYNSFTYTDRLGNGHADLGADSIDPTVWVYHSGSGTWILPKTSALWPTPELNGLLVPIYFWLFQQTGNTLHRDRADLLFDGLVRVSHPSENYDNVAQPFNNFGKVFNQMYSRIWDYVAASVGSTSGLTGLAGAPNMSGLLAAPNTTGLTAGP